MNLTIDNDRFTDFFRRSQGWLVDHIIGEEIEAMLETLVEEGRDQHPDLRKLCQRIIAEKALLDAIPEMDMQLTEAGFAVQDNDDFSPASAQRVDRLVKQMPARILMDCDSLVKFLIGKSDGTQSEPKPYDSWRSTEQYKYLTACFMPTTIVLNRYVQPALVEYEVYYEALPEMAMGMKTVGAYYVSEEEIDRLVELARDGDVMEVHRVAIAWLCRVAAAVYGKNDAAARNYAMYARNTMLASPDSFPEFKASEAYTRKDFSIDGGKTVSFL